MSLIHIDKMLAQRNVSEFSEFTDRRLVFFEADFAMPQDMRLSIARLYTQLNIVMPVKVVDPVNRAVEAINMSDVVERNIVLSAMPCQPFCVQVVRQQRNKYS